MEEKYITQAQFLLINLEMSIPWPLALSSSSMKTSISSSFASSSYFSSLFSGLYPWLFFFPSICMIPVAKIWLLLKDPVGGGNEKDVYDPTELKE